MWFKFHGIMFCAKLAWQKYVPLGQLGGDAPLGGSPVVGVPRYGDAPLGGCPVVGVSRCGDAPLGGCPVVGMSRCGDAPLRGCPLG